MCNQESTSKPLKMKAVKDRQVSSIDSGLGRRMVFFVSTASAERKQQIVYAPKCMTKQSK